MDYEESDYESVGEEEVDLEEVIEDEDGDGDAEEAPDVEDGEVAPDDAFDAEVKLLMTTVESNEELMRRWEEGRDKRTTIPIMTKYEYTKILGIRATQIAAGAPSFIGKDHGFTKAQDIAEEEIRRNVDLFIIERPLPNGKKELWKMSELTITDI